MKEDIEPKELIRYLKTANGSSVSLRIDSRFKDTLLEEDECFDTFLENFEVAIVTDGREVYMVSRDFLVPASQYIRKRYVVPKGIIKVGHFPKIEQNKKEMGLWVKRLFKKVFHTRD